MPNHETSRVRIAEEDGKTVYEVWVKNVLCAVKDSMTEAELCRMELEMPYKSFPSYQP